MGQARELKALNAKSNNTEIQLEEQGTEVGKLRAMVDNLKKVEVVALWREHYGACYFTYKSKITSVIQKKVCGTAKENNTLLHRCYLVMLSWEVV